MQHIYPLPEQKDIECDFIEHFSGSLLKIAKASDYGFQRRTRIQTGSVACNLRIDSRIDVVDENGQYCEPVTSKIQLFEALPLFGERSLKFTDRLAVVFLGERIVCDLRFQLMLIESWHWLTTSLAVHLSDSTILFLRLHESPQHQRFVSGFERVNIVALLFQDVGCQQATPSTRAMGVDDPFLGSRPTIGIRIRPDDGLLQHGPNGGC